MQSESFFDVRRLAVPIRPDLLSAYDRIRDESVLAGRLQVPAWGANTMRTEFGFLTGLDATSLGVHRFNPYRRLARHPWPSLASRLRDQGYQTVCIHPHPVDFFARDRVYPGLGFDRFIDLDDFRQAERCGAYVADAAVTRKILEVLADARQPQLVFAITMENHGPLHLEAPDPAGWSAFYTAPPPAGFEDLSVYLRHLRNADRMIADLTTALREGYSDSLLLFFGDHVPSMPRVYQALEFNDGATDYFIWRPRQAQTGRRRTLRVEALAPWLLDAAGFGIAPAESAR